jgi:hypothetical protein
MSPASNRSQQTGQVNSPSVFGFANTGSLVGTAGVSDCAGGADSGCGTRNSVPQSGQSTLIPAASSSAFNFRPQDGQRNRNSILTPDTEFAKIMRGGVPNSKTKEFSNFTPIRNQLSRPDPPEQKIILRPAGWLRDEMKNAIWKTAGSGQSHFSQVTQILLWSNLTIYSIHLTIA